MYVCICFLKKLTFSITLWMYSSQSQSRFYSVCNFGDFVKKKTIQGFPGDPVVKNPPCNIGDVGSIPGPGRSHMLPSS